MDTIRYLEDLGINPNLPIKGMAGPMGSLAKVLEEFEKSLNPTLEYTPEELLGKRVLAIVNNIFVLAYRVIEFSPDNAYISLRPFQVSRKIDLFSCWYEYKCVNIKCILPEKKVDSDTVRDSDGIPIGPERFEYIVDNLNEKHCTVSSCIGQVVFKASVGDIYLCQHCYNTTLTDTAKQSWYSIIDSVDSNEDIPHDKAMAEHYDKDPESDIEYDGGTRKFHGGV